MPSLQQNLAHLTIIFALAATHTIAQEPAPQAGEYTAAVAINSRPMSVTAEVLTSELGKDSGEVHFGAPWSCRLVLRFSGNMNGGHFYALSRSSGGKCNDLRDGSLVLRAESGGAVPFQVLDSKGSFQTEGNFIFTKR